MNILDTFYEQIDWNGQNYENNEPRPFIEDMSKSAARKHSYAMQIMDDCLTIEPRITARDLEVEKAFLENIKNNETTNPFDNHQNATSNNQLQLKNKKLRPGELLSFINYPRVSNFNATDLKRYKDLCFKIKNGSFTTTQAETFNEFDRVLKEERKEYQEFARKLWITRNYLRHGNILPDVLRYVNEIWKARINRLAQYPELYKHVAMVPLVYNNGADSESNEIDMVPGRVLRKLGKPGRFVFIPRNQHTVLPSSYNDLIQAQPDSASKYPPVSRDPVAEHLVQMNEAQIVISSSGLKCLLDNQCVNVRAAWSVPITVREYPKEKGIKKVVFIDKKFPPKTMTYSERMYWYSKIATRSLYCQRIDDVGYDKGEEIEEDNTISHLAHFGSWESIDTLGMSDNEMESENIVSKENPYACEENSDIDLSDSEDLVIDTSSEESNNEESQIKKSTKKLHQKSDCTRVKNDSTLKMSEKNISRSSMKRFDIPIKSSVHNKVDDTVSSNKSCYIYQMWRLGKENINQLMKTEGEIISVMIRSRRDCVWENYKKRQLNRFLAKFNEYDNMDVDFEKDDTFSQDKDIIVLAPKLEYQFDLGAESTTKSECIRQWVDSVIRPGSQTNRVRINPLTGEVIQIEKLDQSKMKIDGLSKYMNLSKSWCSLYSVLSKLVSLAPGNYLLEQSPKFGAFCSLSAATDKPGVGTINLYRSFNINVEEVAPIQAPWIPLDESVVTPMCRYKSILPLMFPLNTNSYRSKNKKIIGAVLAKKNKKKKSKGLTAAQMDGNNQSKKKNKKKKKKNGKKQNWNKRFSVPINTGVAN